MFIIDIHDQQPSSYLFNDMYDQCVEGAGREVCDQLFGR
jgi:hypothetical protein